MICRNAKELSVVPVQIPWDRPVGWALEITSLHCSGQLTQLISVSGSEPVATQNPVTIFYKLDSLLGIAGMWWNRKSVSQRSWCHLRSIARADYPTIKQMSLAWSWSEGMPGCRMFLYSKGGSNHAVHCGVSKTAAESGRSVQATWVVKIWVRAPITARTTQKVMRHDQRPFFSNIYPDSKESPYMEKS